MGKIAEKESPFFTNHVGLITFTVGAKAGNVINVALVCKDPNGSAIGESFVFDWYLSSDAAGLVIPAAPSSGTAIGTNGTIASGVGSGLAGLGITTAAGLIDFSLTDSGGHNFYLNVVLPSGKKLTSPIMAF